MAVLLTIEGEFKTPSPISGKFDLEDFDVEIVYPVSFTDEDTADKQEAFFYIKHFFLNKILKKKFKAKFRDVRSARITVVEAMDQDQVDEAIENGDLKRIRVDELTAADIKEFKDTDIFWSLILMDGDNTEAVSQKKNVWIGTDMNAKRTLLKKWLGIVEHVEIKQEKNKKKTSALFASSKSSDDKPKEARPVRRKRGGKPNIKVEVSA